MNEKLKEKYSSFILCCIYWGIIMLLTYPFYLTEQLVPDRIYVREWEDIRLPFLFSGNYKETAPVSVSGTKTITKDEISITEEKLVVKLFGMIPIKESAVSIIDECEVYPCGASVGLYLKSDGLLVVGTTAITDEQGNLVDPARDILKSGDSILSCNGISMTKKEDLIELLQKENGEDVVCIIKRNGQSSEVRITPVYTKNGDYKLGIWIRDDVQGIGTVTYMKENGEFGALGHPISDPDTGKVFPSINGSVYRSEVQYVQKGKNGNPGSLSGTILYGKTNCMGHIYKNCEAGIYGIMDKEYINKIRTEPMPIAIAQEVKKGTAYIQSNVDGTLKHYEIEIKEVRNGSQLLNKQIAFEVMDPELLEITGGIVQGMSGSPIIQNGKLIGAVTHVLVNDPTRGYGIFIENMLEAAE